MSPVNTTPNVPHRNFLPDFFTGLGRSVHRRRVVKGRPSVCGSIQWRVHSVAGAFSGGSIQWREHSVAGAFHDRIIIIEMPEKAEDPQDIGVIDGVIDGL